MRLSRIALGAAVIAVALSGGSSQLEPARTTVNDTAATHGKTWDTSTRLICGEPHYAFEEMHEVRIGDKCAALYKDNDPTTEVNHTVFQYMISPERQAILHAAYTPAANTLLDKMLGGEIPYKIHGDVDVDPSGNVRRDEKGVAIFKPAPFNGWGTIESDFPQKTTELFSGSDGHISLDIRMKDGKVDRSVEPLRFSFNSRRGMIDMNGPYVLVGHGDVLTPGTSQAFSWGHYMMGVNEDHVHSISLIDYVDPMGLPYSRVLKPTDMDITVVAEPVYDPVTHTSRGTWTPDDIRNQDADFIDILNRELRRVNGSDWRE